MRASRSLAGRRGARWWPRCACAPPRRRRARRARVRCAQPPSASTASRGARACVGLLSGVDDVDAAILGPRGFVVAHVLAAFPCRSSPSRRSSPGRPCSVIMRLTASARFWPSAMLYSREPRSSAWPCSVTRALRLAARYFACASTMGLYWSATREAVELEVDAALAQDVVGIAQRIGAAGAGCVPVTPPCVVPLVVAPPRRARGRRGARLVLDRRGGRRRLAACEEDRDERGDGEFFHESPRSL